MATYLIIQLTIERLTYQNGSDDTDPDNGRPYHHVMTLLGPEQTADRETLKTYEQGCVLGRGFTAIGAVTDYCRRFRDYRDGLRFTIGDVYRPKRGINTTGSAQVTLHIETRCTSEAKRERQNR